MSNDFYMYQQQRFKYKISSEHVTMGLDNKVCDNPVYYCALKQVYLTNDDVRRKRCLNLPTFDLLGTTRCTSLRDIHKNSNSEKIDRKTYNKPILIKEEKVKKEDSSLYCKCYKTWCEKITNCKTRAISCIECSSSLLIKIPPIYDSI